MTWLNELVESHSELESPTSFWYWSGLCIISAIVKDNIWMDCGGAFPLYPNIYVMLHADSGLKKGPPIGLAKNLVQSVNNTKLFVGRSSIQGILKELGTAQSSSGSGRVDHKSTGFILSSEFSSSLVADPQAMTILTDLYDRQYNSGAWTSLLKQEKFDLKDPTISLLCATNEAHFEDFIDAKDVHGGFIGRMFVIAESEVNQLNPLITPLRHKPDKIYLATYLKELAKITGEFEPIGANEKSERYHLKRILQGIPEWYTEAGADYHDWYMEFHTEIKKRGVKDETGTIQRIGDSVKKVAMLLSLSESPELVITSGNMEEAIDAGHILLKNVVKTTHGTGMSSVAKQKAKILKIMVKTEGHEVTRKFMIRKMQMDVTNSKELDEIMMDFDQSGAINVINEGNTIIYKMPPDQVKAYEGYFEDE